ncbi:MAG: AMP-binding protein, partial [Candidatus Marinimicrobia bacterium]|nr:AMP-binding protein [Candidatus Neomarinimicrobiota bacterium]
MDENLIELIEESIKSNWRQPALSNYQSENISYKMVGKNIMDMHKIFEEIKVDSEDKIALLGKNSANWAISYLSVVSYRAIVVPMLSHFHTKDIAHIIKH